MESSPYYGGTALRKPVAGGINIVALCSALRDAIAKANAESMHLEVRILREQLYKIEGLDTLVTYSLTPEA